MSPNFKRQALFKRRQKTVFNKPSDMPVDPPAKSMFNKLESSLHIQNFGVYTVYREKKTKRDSLHSICVRFCNKWNENLTAVVRLVWEVYMLAPVLFFFLVLSQLLQNTQELILLHYETRIMRTIEIGISKGGIDTKAITQAVGARILSVMIIKGLSILSVQLDRRLRSRVYHHFEQYLLTCKLGLDMSMLADNLKNDGVSADSVWNTTEGFIGLLCGLFGLLSQLGFIYHLGRSSNYAAFFVFLCLVNPILTQRSSSSISEPFVIETTNPHYLRIKSLEGLVEKQFRSDIMSGNIVQYIIDQFRKAQAALGDTTTESPEILFYSMNEESLWRTFIEATDDLPMVFTAALALINPTTTNLYTIFSLRQSANSLKTSFWRMFYEFGSLERRADVAVRLYDMEKKMAQTVVKDGELLYGTPVSETEGRVSEKKSSQGMGIEMRNVSFSYPGGGAKALDNTSFSISPGQLVVIVGANGSGKSTFIKLLSRLYNASSGEILVDGIDITEYNLASIRQAMAMLTQDHHLYPLSIKENIGLGFAEKVYDEELIIDAAKKGGAETVIKRFREGMETVLDPRGYQDAYKVSSSDQTALGEKLRGLRKTVDVSGGEKQRLVAARTFMRFNSGKVKLVAVDEPSSALDPEAELELFDNIRNSREGKTVIFVTHRFGHLTKHADLILCMDKGQVIESGTHSELMGKGGRYCRMYNIQAQAFESKQEERQQ